MALKLVDKQKVVEEVAAVAADAHSAIAAEYSGINVEQMTDLRVKARNDGVYLRVVKNSLARRALEGTEFACMADDLVGQLILAFSIEDPAAAARLVNDFAKENEQLQVKLVSLGGELLDPSEVKRLANLPTKDQAISMMMALMLAPVEQLARTLNEVPTKVTRSVAAVRDQKQAAG